MPMKRMLLMVLALNFVAGWGAAGEEEAGYAQTYIIFLEGAKAGKESVSEKIAGNGDRIAQSESEIFVNDGMETRRMAFETRMVLDGKSWTPRSYLFRYTSGNTGDHYEVDIQGDQITRSLTRGSETSIASGKFGPDSVILDINVYHQYDYLVHKYDFGKGGRQLFADYIPVIGNDIPVALTFLEESGLKSVKGELRTKEFKIEFVGLRNGTVVVDGNGRLVRLIIPDQKLEVVREDLL